MSYISGILTVPAFTATGNAGEFNITGATYNNQSDVSGQGTSVLAVGFVLYVQASDANSFLPIPGVAHRYKITALTIVDQSTINATVLYDEVGSTTDQPTNGSDCIISSTSDALKYGYIADQALYGSLPAGIVSGMLNSETEKITDPTVAARVISLNGLNGDIILAAGTNIHLTSSGQNVEIDSTGCDEGIY